MSGMTFAVEGMRLDSGIERPGFGIAPVTCAFIAQRTGELAAAISLWSPPSFFT